MEESKVFPGMNRSLEKMMDAGTGEGLWRADKLGAILEHQLSAPLAPDLSVVDREVGTLLKKFAVTEGSPLGSFCDLFHHPQPPVELLELAKQFAKRCRSHPDGPLPDEVATVLYLLSIVVAMTRCGRRISRLDDEALGYGIQWALAQSWLDEGTRQLLGAGDGGRSG